MTRHSHKAATSKTYAWTRCVGPASCSGCSHGAVEIVETCACGATRRTESNGRHTATRGWQKPEAK